MDIVNEVSLVEERALSSHTHRHATYTYVHSTTVPAPSTTGPNKGGPLENLRFPDRIRCTSLGTNDHNSYQIYVAAGASFYK